MSKLTSQNSKGRSGHYSAQYQKQRRTLQGLAARSGNVLQEVLRNSGLSLNRPAFSRADASASQPWSGRKLPAVDSRPDACGTEDSIYM
jgi:hypothetical protein